MKYIVVHSGSRDQYNLAESLYKHDKLGFLVTDDILFRKEYRNLFPRKNIKISLLGLFFRCILQIFPSWEWMHPIKDRFLGRTAGKLSKKYNMRLLGLSEYAYHAYQYSDVRPRIVFQFHPHAYSNKKIFMEEAERHPETAANLKLEKECFVSPKKLKESWDEIKMTDYFIVASSFTKQTLIENGANENKIFIAPYGVDTTKYPFKERKGSNLINFVFVGSYTERKGIYYLLSAAKKLELEGYNFKLRMTGRAKYNPEMLTKYGLKNIEFYHNLSHKQLIDLLHSSDVFVFPSLCEGFAFVIIEAMSTGLPIISTTRTAGRDIVREGIDGFTINPSSVDELYEKMKYFITNPEQCSIMGKNAAATAKTITWDNFENKVISAIETIENQYKNS